jgi:hypothetical protein
MTRRRHGHVPTHRGVGRLSARRPRRVAALLSVLAGLGTVLVAQWAFGYWTASATGTGAGATGSDVVLTFSAGTPTSTLYPGGSAAVALTVRNPTYASVTIGSLWLDATRGTGGLAVDGAHSGCSVATLGYSTQDNGGSGWSVPARVGATDGTLALSLPGALSMGTDAADACQGATFTVYLRAAP